jgi:hypothetical protein
MGKLKRHSFYFLAKNLIFVLFTSAIFFSGFFVCVYADEEIEEDLGYTSISDSIMEDTTWTKEGSPYVILEPIMIASDATLTIEPGVVVKFDTYSNVYLFILGKVIALGSNEEPIVFTSIYDDTGGSTDDDYKFCDYEEFDEYGEPMGDEVCEMIDGGDPSVGDWYSLYFRDSTGSDFENVFIQYAEDAVYMENSTVDFSNLDISESNYGLIADNSHVNIIGGSASRLEAGGFQVYSGSNLILNDFTFDGSEINVYSNSSMEIINSKIEDLSNSIGAFMNSTLTINNSSISSLESGIDVYMDSFLNLSDVEITCVDYCITLYNNVTADIDKTKISGANNAGVMAFGNTLTNTISVTNSEITGNDIGFIVWDTNMSVHQNSIHDNFSAGAITYPTDPLPINLDFTNNWWGDLAGPNHPTTNPNGHGDEISDNILYDPWLLYDPLIQEGISSVMFIPGFQASRIYKQSIGSLGTRYEDKLWEPNNNSDIEDIYMDQFGLSINKDVYIRDIINEATVFGLKTLNFYKSFSSQMDKMVDDGEILEWKPIAYDWRLSPQDIVEYGVEDQSGDIYYNRELSEDETPYIISQLEELSNNSKTGKVTIVTHSNGGLVAKALVYKLIKMKESGASDLIDKIDNLIIVAAPQLGTPKATAGILHGYDQGMMLNMLLGRKDARYFGQTLPGAYGLLPSQSYTDNINNDLIFFDKSLDNVNNWRSKYGDSIDSYEEFESFLLDKESLRTQPHHDDLVNPTILNKFILDKINSLHENIDNIEIPDSISIHQIAGWGLPTIFDFIYKSKNECSSFLDLLCLKKKVVLSSDVGFTSAGDGTVVGASALFGKGKYYYLNLKTYNKNNKFDLNKDHVDMFEVSYLFDIIHNILKKDSNLPEYFTLSAPEVGSYTVLKMRSPVSIDIYDDEGLHTGLLPDGEEVETEIPNSLYLEFADEKYIVVPTEGNYKLKLKGLSDGIFTLEEEIIGEEGVSQTVVFRDIPTTSNLLGEVDVVSGLLASSISLDEDGDSVFEKVIKPTDENIIEEDQKGRSLSSGSYIYNPLIQKSVDEDESIQVNDLVLNDIFDIKEFVLPNLNKENIIEEEVTVVQEEKDGSLLASVGLIDESNNPSLRVQIITVGCFILLLLGLKFIFKVL